MNWLKQNWFKIGLLIILVVFVAGIFYWYELRPNQDEVKNSKLYKPQNLKDGQCVIQVMGERSNLFDEMKEKCRVLVVLDEQGLITEIIEK